MLQKISLNTSNQVGASCQSTCVLYCVGVTHLISESVNKWWESWECSPTTDFYPRLTTIAELNFFFLLFHNVTCDKYNDSLVVFFLISAYCHTQRQKSCTKLANCSIAHLKPHCTPPLLLLQRVTHTNTLHCALTNITTDGEGDGNHLLYRKRVHKAPSFSIPSCTHSTVKSTSAPFHPLAMKPVGWESGHSSQNH